MRIAFTLLSAPPARHIGSELMSLRLARALVDAGHDVTVHPTVSPVEHVHDGVRIVTAPAPADVDAVVCHADYGIRARHLRKVAGAPIVSICHNTGPGVKVGLVNTAPALAVVNSHAMADRLGLPDALVVHPPAPPVRHVTAGRCVTILSLNELKGAAQFWRVAESLPAVPFVAVQGGYGDQDTRTARNVQVLPHMPPGDLTGRVWRHTGIFLQLAESESWGMAAAEAIAHGIPVIAHPTPGLVENLADAAVWVDRDDIAGICEAIHLIRSNPAPFRAAALARARQHVETSAKQVAEWVAAVESIGGS